MRHAVVVDASLAIKWALSEPMADEALRLLLGWQSRGTLRLVPTLFLSEINTPLLKQRRAGALTEIEMGRARDMVLDSVTARPDSVALTGRALVLADRLGLRTAHDCLYLALAESEGCYLWSADERFYNVTRGAALPVRWLGELSSV